MRLDLKITEANNGKRVLAYFLDLIACGISIAIIYFLLIVSIINPIFHHDEMNKQKEDILSTYNLNLDNSSAYIAYMSSVQNFYFEAYKDDIVNAYKQRGYLYNNEPYTIEHIYNIEVLGLPKEPTVISYENTMFSYEVKEGGTIDVDSIGLTKYGVGRRYEKNLLDTYRTAYNHLFTYLENFNEDYARLKHETAKLESVTRLIASLLGIGIYFILIPTVSKYGTTLFENIEGLALVSENEGYLLPRYKIIIKGILTYIIPLIGIVGFNRYTIVILLILPLFINFVVMILSNKHQTLPSKLLKIICVDKNASTIFASIEEENAYEENRVEDEDFISRLEKIQEVNIQFEEKEKKDEKQN